MDSSWKRPESKMVKARAAASLTTEDLDDAKDYQEHAAAQAKLERQKQENEDKIGKLIGESWFIMNWTTPILAHPVLSQLSVTRFYPEAFVAIDIFTHIGDEENRVIEFKRKAFKENDVEHGGIKGRVRYGALSYSDPLSALAPQLEA